MFLRDHERDFLAAFIHEATTDPFKGPATEVLHSRGIYYADITHLMTAYYRENEPGQEGLGGKPRSIPLLCPWPNRESAVLRDKEMEKELVKSGEAQATA
jgi:hypothetical protein